MQHQHAAQTVSQQTCKSMQALPTEMAVPLARGDKAFVLRWIPEEPSITELAPLRCTLTVSRLLRWCSMRLYADGLQAAGGAACSAPSAPSVSPSWAPCHQGATHWQAPEAFGAASWQPAINSREGVVVLTPLGTPRAGSAAVTH